VYTCRKREEVDMENSQVLMIVGANVAMIFGMLGTVVALYLHTDKKIDAIAAEMKDFHGKLCAIEEKSKK
jgi:hypothetical protein